MDTLQQAQTFYFSEGPYLQALQGLHSALCAPEALVKLVGQPRTGKSTLCGKLTQFLQHKDYQVVYFDYAIESPEMLRAMLVQELDLPDSFNFVRQLQDMLASASDKPIIIIFDDAHLLTDVTLLEIYRLADNRHPQKQAINILLCGEPSLEKGLLDKKEFRSLHRHVSHNFVLNPMTADAAAAFLAAYVVKAGLPKLRLDTAAMACFYKSCKGFPGVATSLCQLLVAARTRQTQSLLICKNELMSLIKQADDSLLLPTLAYRENKKLLHLGPPAAVLVIASLAILYQQLNGFDSLESSLLPASATVAELAPFIVQGPLLPLDAEQVESIQVAEVLADNSAEFPPSAEAQADDNAPEVVSDSNLSLVTAEEIGLTAADIVEPIFEALMLDSSAATVRVLVADSNQAAVSLENRIVAGENTPVEDALAIPAQTTASSHSESDIVAAESESTFPAVPQEVIEPLSTTESVLADAPASAREESIDAVLSVEQAVHAWIAAWEGQAFELYFSSYHAEFEPRYHRSRSEWQRDRERVIGNANSISLELSDFTIISEDAVSVEVHFWLAYQSPTYQDDTRKKLVLRKQSPIQGSVGSQTLDKWLILEEVNLEVRS